MHYSIKLSSFAALGRIIPWPILLVLCFDFQLIIPKYQTSRIEPHNKNKKNKKRNEKKRKSNQKVMKWDPAYKWSHT